MLVLVRDAYTETAILGRLFIGGTCICSTLENRSKAIPCGTYNIANSKSPKFKRELPLIYSARVPASRGVRIHVGNSVKDSSGCVLVGMGRDAEKMTLKESQLAETMLVGICRGFRSLVVVDCD